MEEKNTSSGFFFWPLVGLVCLVALLWPFVSETYLLVPDLEKNVEETITENLWNFSSSKTEQNFYEALFASRFQGLVLNLLGYIAFYSLFFLSQKRPDTSSIIRASLGAFGPTLFLFSKSQVTSLSPAEEKVAIFAAILTALIACREFGKIKNANFAQSIWLNLSTLAAGGVFILWNKNSALLYYIYLCGWYLVQLAQSDNKEKIGWFKYLGVIPLPIFLNQLFYYIEKIFIINILFITLNIMAVIFTILTMKNVVKELYKKLLFLGTSIIILEISAQQGAYYFPITLGVFLPIFIIAITKEKNRLSLNLLQFLSLITFGFVFYNLIQNEVLQASNTQKALGFYINKFLEKEGANSRISFRVSKNAFFNKNHSLKINKRSIGNILSCSQCLKKQTFFFAETKEDIFIYLQKSFIKNQKPQEKTVSLDAFFEIPFISERQNQKSKENKGFKKNFEISLQAFGYKVSSLKYDLEKRGSNLRSALSISCEKWLERIFPFNSKIYSHTEIDERQTQWYKELRSEGKYYVDRELKWDAKTRKILLKDNMNAGPKKFMTPKYKPFLDPLSLVWIIGEDLRNGCLTTIYKYVETGNVKLISIKITRIKNDPHLKKKIVEVTIKPLFDQELRPENYTKLIDPSKRAELYYSDDSFELIGGALLYKNFPLRFDIKTHPTATAM